MNPQYNVHYDQSNILPPPPQVGHVTPHPGQVPLRPDSMGDWVQLKGMNGSVGDWVQLKGMRGMGQGVVDKYPGGWAGIAVTAVGIIGLIWLVRR